MSSLQSTELFQQQTYINGQWLAAQSNATVPVSNPATGEEIGTIPNMGAVEATQAVEAAYTALQSWKALTAQTVLISYWLGINWFSIIPMNLL